MMKVNARYGFSAVTAFLAINYLDKLLSSLHSQRDKPWMIQLAAVTCLSLSAKVEETQVSLLLGLQVEDNEYAFEAKTIQRMDFLVLSTFQWKMNPVTPLSFIDLIIRRLGLKTHATGSCSTYASVGSDDRRYLLDLMRVTPRDANYTGPGSRFCILRQELITAFCQAEVAERLNLGDLTIEGKIETAPADDLVKSDFTLSERISCDTKSAPVDEVYNSVLETTPVGDSVKPYVSLSEEVIFDAKGVPGEEAYKSTVETAFVVDLVKPEMSVSGEVICVTDSAPLGNSVADFVSDTNTAMKVGVGSMCFAALIIGNDAIGICPCSFDVTSSSSSYTVWFIMDAYFRALKDSLNDSNTRSPVRC
ncbi:Cyclin-D3-1 [Vitis vinifera]|uniref:Cyclin-D3-1 n=1 Tax=Vitis vinifera TaxID=29760 RepID=A0A438H735_VITVI|nr:Cyclin-D3-1 [Vitis vinifera]